METGTQILELEDLVAVFSGEITGIWPQDKVDRVDVRYEFLNHHRLDGWPRGALQAKNIPLVEGTKVKVGMYKTQEGVVGVKVLTEEEASTYQEPQTEIEKLQQKLDFYRLITKNEYNL